MNISDGGFIAHFRLQNDIVTDGRDEGRSIIALEICLNI